MCVFHYIEKQLYNTTFFKITGFLDQYRLDKS